jgi:tetratricopeptide (TPR) repeat protein
VDSQINAAARALASGDPLGALDRVALRNDPPALALRGIAMAQLGDLERARALLSRAARAFGNGEPLARARCVTARLEVGLALRDLGSPARGLDAAIEVLERHGDRANAIHARLLRARRWLLLGRIDETAAECQRLELDGAPPRIAAMADLVLAELAVRRVRAGAARAALQRARTAAERARIAALVVEIDRSLARLDEPAARIASRGAQRPATLAEVEALFDADVLIVDGCRRSLRHRGEIRGLARRPVLFELARALTAAWPGDVPRERLLAEVFGARVINDSWRTRLRVEVGRLRRAMRGLADARATPSGFALVPVAGEVAILHPPVDGSDAAVLALLADGAAWSTSALALALGVSQRTVQRSLAALEADGRVQSFGRARARRWLARPIVGIATPLLLPDIAHNG